jgi:hypothetical protein
MKVAFNHVFENQMPKPPSRLFTDQGKEFEAEEMKRFFREKWMIDKRCSSDKSVKAGMAERMIRTIRHRLHRYFSEKNTERWVDVIDDIMGAINRSVCRVTSMRPIDVNEDNANRLWERLYGVDHRQIRRTNHFKKDDAVRLALNKPVFKKGTMPTVTDEIFRVDEKVASGIEPVHYYIRDHKGERIKGRVYGPEMTKTREDADTTYRIERVIKRKRDKAGVRKALVKFIGYPDTYWIDEIDDIVVT